MKSNRKETTMRHSGLSVRFAPIGCLVLAVLAAGCGGATRGRGRARASSDTALALAIGYDKPDIVRVEFEETYPEEAWKTVRETEGQLAYRKMTAGVVWEWALLDEIAAARAGSEAGIKKAAKVKQKEKPKGKARRRPKEEKVAEKAEREKPPEAEEKEEGKEEPEEKATAKEEPKKRRRGRSRRKK